MEFLGDWAIDSGKCLILNIVVGGVYPFNTNGVHVPYYGIPEATVEAIGNGEIKLLVDWVKVTRN